MAKDASEFNFVGKAFKILNFLKSNEEEQVNTVDVNIFSPTRTANEKAEFFKFVNTVSKKFELTVEKRKILRRVQNWWRNHIKRRNFDFFTQEEFAVATASINKGTVGPDHIHVKFWPKRSENLEKFRWAVNGFLFSSKRFAVSTLKQRMKFIPKGSGKLRPLNIGSRLVNLYSTLVSNRLGKFLTSHSFYGNRFGFIPGRNVDLLKFYMNDHVTDAKENGLRTNLVSMDLRDAYLKCNPLKLVSKLHKLVRASNEVKNLGVCLGYCLKWVSGLNIREVFWFDSETGRNLVVIMRSGLSQGDSVSAVYFIVYFDFESGSLEVKILFFADDSNALISTDSWTETDSLTGSYIDEFTEWTMENDLTFSHERSKILSLNRRNMPGKIGDVPVVKNSSLRVLGLYLDGNWCYSKHVMYLKNYFKIRANLLKLLRIQLNLSYRCITNMVLNLRNRITFGSFYLLQLSRSQFSTVENMWNKTVKKAFGFSKLVSPENVCNFIGIQPLDNYLNYWFLKWYIANPHVAASFDTYFSWKESQPLPGRYRYNFRKSTL